METAALFRKLGIDPDAPADAPARAFAESVLRAAMGASHADQWLTTREAARYAGVSGKTLRRWAEEPGSVIERRSGSGRAPDRYRRGSIDDYLSASSSAAPTVTSSKVAK